MPLSEDQVAMLLRLIGSVKPDPLDCDGCFEHLAEFAESELKCQDIPSALKAVENHLQQCPCCEAEYEALLTGLRAMQV